MFNQQNLSSKSLFKKVNYLLATANLSFDLLVGLRKGTIYRLLKKAAKINGELHLEKQELKELAALIANYSITAKEVVRVYKKLLKVTDLIESSNDEEFIFSFEETPYIGTFFDKKQIIRV